VGLKSNSNVSGRKEGSRTTNKGLCLESYCVRIHLRSRYEITCPFIGISLRLLMPFPEFLRSSYSLTTAYQEPRWPIFWDRNSSMPAHPLGPTTARRTGPNRAAILFIRSASWRKRLQSHIIGSNCSMDLISVIRSCGANCFKKPASCWRYSRASARLRNCVDFRNRRSLVLQSNSRFRSGLRSPNRAIAQSRIFAFVQSRIPAIAHSRNRAFSQSRNRAIRNPYDRPPLPYLAWNR